MGETLALISRKGGNGKTSTASAITAGFLSMGYRVLVVDMDGQGSISHIMGAGQGASVLDVLTGEADIRAAIQHTDSGDIIAADPGLDMADLTLTAPGREYLLRDKLAGVRADYDLIVLDTLPSFGVLTLNAMAAASGVVIPSQADVLSLNALAQSYELVQSARQAVNPSLAIWGILLTRFNPRSILNRDIADSFTEAAAAMGTRVFKARIRDGVAVKEAQARQQDLFKYAKRSNPARDYWSFVVELEAVLKEAGK